MYLGIVLSYSTGDTLQGIARRIAAARPRYPNAARKKTRTYVQSLASLEEGTVVYVNCPPPTIFGISITVCPRGLAFGDLSLFE